MGLSVPVSKSMHERSTVIVAKTSHDRNYFCIAVFAAERGNDWQGNVTLSGSKENNRA
jgi:hypothetical protein